MSNTVETFKLKKKMFIEFKTLAVTEYNTF